MSLLCTLILIQSITKLDPQKEASLLNGSTKMWKIL